MRMQHFQEMAQLTSTRVPQGLNRLREKGLDSNERHERQTSGPRADSEMV
jgi:hypothetical protein